MNTLLDDLRQHCGADRVLSEPTDLIPYSFDGTAELRQLPAAVVFPRSTAEVAACVKSAVHHGVPIVTRGAGTGLSGGSVPVPGCLVICMVDLKAILAVDPANLTLRAQPGAITADIDAAAEAEIFEQFRAATRDQMAILISHRFSTVRQADVIGVLHQGRLVELGATLEVFGRPQHPYTRKLLASRPVRVVQPVPADAPVLLDGQAAEITTPGDGDGRWCLLCDEHGGIATFDLLANARSYMAHPREWCATCQQLTD
jgi:hypothetical protein